jgi:hypothetical protein
VHRGKDLAQVVELGGGEDDILGEPELLERLPPNNGRESLASEPGTVLAHGPIILEDQHTQA